VSCALPTASSAAAKNRTWAISCPPIAGELRDVGDGSADILRRTAATPGDEPGHECAERSSRASDAVRDILREIQDERDRHVLSGQIEVLAQGIGPLVQRLGR